MVEFEGTGLIGLGRLAKVVFQGGDLSAERERLLERLACDENDASAMMDLSTLMQLMGHRDCGLQLQKLALELRRVFPLGHTGVPGIRLLSISCPGDLAENNALEFLVDGTDIALETLYIEPGVPLPPALPEHDVAMVAICESDRNQPILQYADRLVQTWPKPMLCSPRRIAALSRDSASQLLQGLRGTVTPVTQRLRRPFTAGLPIVARPVDSHKGHGLKRLDTTEAIGRYLEERTEGEFYVAPYMDFRSSDGQFRKYRIVFISGVPFVCHVAISGDWMVHYLSSGMVENATKRAEEARLFETFDECFAKRHERAFQGICDRVDLAYFGIDCAETQSGNLLVFEVDSGMTVHAMDLVEVFQYKQPQMRKVFRAFRRMLEHAAAGTDSRAGLKTTNCV